MEDKLQTLLKLMVTYNPNKKDIELVKKAYDIANTLHSDVKRESGEPYISHPLEVATILAQVQADASTIIAALLHDTLEDTWLRKEELAYIFGEYVADLVDGVTNINKAKFSSKKEADATNTRKLLQGMFKDVRVLYIKLADRLHNMRTLDYKKPEKRKKKAKETLELFVPLASYLGCHEIKNELQTLSFKYYLPEEYENYLMRQKKLMEENKEKIENMVQVLNKTLDENYIPHEIYYREKNLYEVYLQEKNHEELNEIHDLIAIKIKVLDINDCYKVLGLVHSLYRSYDNKFKDYITKPKKNKYQSLHTTVFVDRTLVQVQIRTYQMDRVANLGLTAYWNDRNVIMNDELHAADFFKSLVEINSIALEDTDFVEDIYREVLTKNVYVYTRSGEYVELPEGSTGIDFAYKINPEIGNHLQSLIVNGQFEKIEYVLKNLDIVTAISTDDGHPYEDWLGKCKTKMAKTKIKKYLEEN